MTSQPPHHAHQRVAVSYQQQPEQRRERARSGSPCVVMPRQRSAGIGGHSTAYASSGIGGHITAPCDTGIGKACLSKHQRSSSFFSLPSRASSPATPTKPKRVASRSTSVDSRQTII
ncbi:hypothetical protein LPJ70_001531 [Coemansia sp. RSA 2708]|nr:hypothetical protein LPJ70_001531 [Coemansia sp. RSA 2708]